MDKSSADCHVVCAVCGSEVTPHPLNPRTFYCATCDRPWFPWYVALASTEGTACPWPCSDPQQISSP